jgi:hypothetical protein
MLIVAVFSPLALSFRIKVDVVEMEFELDGAV